MKYHRIITLKNGQEAGTAGILMTFAPEPMDSRN